MTKLPNNGKGRPPGARNKRTLEFMAVLEKENFDPAMALIECYREAKKTYDNYGVIYDALSDAKSKTGDPFPVEDKADKYLKIAADIAKDLASYAYPKLKQIEQKKNNPLENMTPEQKLEAMKQAVAALEIKYKEETK